MWPHEVEPWFCSWYRGRVETLDELHHTLMATLTVQRKCPRCEKIPNLDNPPF